jgi:hypothetical protein
MRGLLNRRVRAFSVFTESGGWWSNAAIGEAELGGGAASRCKRGPAPGLNVDQPFTAVGAGQRDSGATIARLWKENPALS